MTRAERLRAPLLILLWGLLALEAAGGLVIFCARLIDGSLPGETLHIIGGVALTFVYAFYQWGHWRRVRPFRTRLDHGIGLLSAIFLALTQLTGFALGLEWWRDRSVNPVSYSPSLSAVHNIGSMLVLTFVGAHLGAVLLRDRTRDQNSVV